MSSRTIPRPGSGADRWFGIKSQIHSKLLDSLSADQLKATTAPMFFIHGDADGVRLEHISEMYRLKGGEIHGDMRPRSASRLAILPNTTHVTLMDRRSVIIPMVNDFLDAKPQKP